MTQNNISWLVVADIQSGKEGFYKITSKNLPGLYLSGQDLHSIIEDVPNVIKALFKLNDGIEVEVRRLADRSVKKALPCQWTATPIAA